MATGGTLLLAGAVLLARHTLFSGGHLGGMVVDPIGRKSVDAHMRFVAFTYLAGVVALVGLVAVAGRGRLLRAAAAAAVVAVVFLQGGWLLRDHNPTVDADLVYADSPGLPAVKAAAGPNEETVFLGVLLSADANLWYGIRSSDFYDGVGVFRYEQLRNDLAAVPPPIGGSRTLEVLGIRYVAAELGVFPTAIPATRLPAKPTFTATVNGLHAITAGTAEPAPGGASCQVTLQLVDTASEDVAARSTAPCRKPYTTLSFPPIADSIGHTYRADFGGDVATLAFAPWAQGMSGLEQVEGNDKVALFRAPGSPARYFSPAEARPVASDDEARKLLLEPGFSMARTALVHDLAAGAPATSGSEGQVEVLEQGPTKVRLKVTRADPGWMVAIQTSFPGWTATVDGKSTKLHRADYAFTAVPVGAGTHEVVLRYRPVSVRYGMIVTGEALVLMVIWLATARPRTPRARRERIPWDPTKQRPAQDPPATSSRRGRRGAQGPPEESPSLEPPDPAERPADPEPESPPLDPSAVPEPPVQAVPPAEPEPMVQPRPKKRRA